MEKDGALLTADSLTLIMSGTGTMRCEFAREAACTSLKADISIWSQWRVRLVACGFPLS